MPAIDTLESPVGTRRRRPPTRRRWRRVLVILAGAVGAGLALAWLGLRFEPRPLPEFPLEAGAVRTVPLPDGLPDPVERFYTVLYGDEVPVVDTAVISGRGRMRIAGVSFPARFRFSHVTGRDYRHHIEITAFGARLASVDEWYLDGHARLDLPVGVSEGPQVDQGANLALWAEAVWMPSVWVTDPQARWEPIDTTSARLTVPFGDDREAFTVRFDPDTGLLRSLTSMRFKGEADEERTRWINDAVDWGVVDGRPVPLRATVTWTDEGSPWADLRTEQVRYNADLERYVRQSGP